MKESKSLEDAVDSDNYFEGLEEIEEYEKSRKELTQLSQEMNFELNKFIERKMKENTSSSNNYNEKSEQYQFNNSRNENRQNAMQKEYHTKGQVKIFL